MEPGKGKGRSGVGELGSHQSTTLLVGSPLTLCAQPMLAAVGGATVQLAARSTLPEVAGAFAVAIHTGPVPTTVGWLAAGFVHTHHRGHTAGTAPHVVLAVGDSL